MGTELVEGTCSERGAGSGVVGVEVHELLDLLSWSLREVNVLEVVHDVFRTCDQELGDEREESTLIDHVPSNVGNIRNLASGSKRTRIIDEVSSVRTRVPVFSIS